MSDFNSVSFHSRHPQPVHHVVWSRVEVYGVGSLQARVCCPADGSPRTARRAPCVRGSAVGTALCAPQLNEHATKFPMTTSPG